MEILARFVKVNTPKGTYVDWEWFLEVHSFKSRFMPLIVGGLLLTVLSITLHMLFVNDIISISSDYVKDAIGIVALLSFCVFPLMSVYYWGRSRLSDQELLLYGEFKRARRDFLKIYKQDILKCEDVMILGIHVSGLLHLQAKLPGAEQKKTLRVMWDTGNNFVNVPSYEELYRN